MQTATVKQQLELHFICFFLSIETNLEATQNEIEIKVHTAWLYRKLKYEVEMSTNLWISLSSHIYIHSKRKPWCTSFVMTPTGLPFYTSMKRGGSEHRNERAAIGHFQKVGLVGKLVPGCLVCCQTLDNLIRDLIN